MEEKIQKIREWLGTGAVNIFGLPMSGKDTVGLRLAEVLGGKLLSSGEIIRAVEAERRQHMTDKGALIPTDAFYEIVLPYFYREEIREYPLVLSSIGRWSGEEDRVMATAEEAGHPIRAAVVLNVSEADVIERWNTAKLLGDRGERADDKKEEVFQTRIMEFRTKTMPVILKYKSLGKLVEVRADGTREEVFSELIEKLYQKALQG